MRRLVLLSLAIVLLTTGIHADDWAVGVSTGPFVFGNFAESTRVISNEEQTVEITSTLSAATRAGARVELERFFNQQFSARLEATFTDTELSVKSETDDDPDSDGVTLDVGELSVTTIEIPIAWRINRSDRFRVQVFIGPAVAMYDLDPQIAVGGVAVPLFEGSRTRWGGVAGAGVEWFWGEKWAARATISDLVTSSPLERSDFGPRPVRRLDIPKTHNVHTAFGVLRRF